MSYLLGLPTKSQMNRLNFLLGGKNIEKHKQTCAKNRKKRKLKK